MAFRRLWLLPKHAYLSDTLQEEHALYSANTCAALARHSSAPRTAPGGPRVGWCGLRHQVLQDSPLFTAYFFPLNYFHNNLKLENMFVENGEAAGLAYRPTSQSARGSAIVSEKNTRPPQSPRSGALRTRPLSTSQKTDWQQDWGRHLKLENRASFLAVSSARLFPPASLPLTFSLPPFLLLPPPLSSYLAIFMFYGNLCLYFPVSSGNFSKGLNSP